MNNEERKMLECAAKAIGGGYSHGRDVCANETGYLHIGDDVDYWNPINNDGDAFRLMVSLEMDVFCGDSFVNDNSVNVNTRHAEMIGLDHDPEGECDHKALVRRAISLAAARLGGYDG